MPVPNAPGDHRDGFASPEGFRHDRRYRAPILVADSSGNFDSVRRSNYGNCQLGRSQTGLFGHKENPLSAESRPVPPSPNPPPRPQPDNGVRTVHTGIDYFLGAWINIDPNTGSVPKLSVSLAGQNVLVHAWGACHPTPCDWGEVQAEPYASTVSSKISSDTTKLQGVFKPAFAETTFLIYPEGEERLRFERSTRFTDNSGRANYSSMDIFQRAK